MTGDIGLVLAIGMLVIGIVGAAFGVWQYFSGADTASEVRQRAEIEKVYALIETRSNEYDGRFAALKDRVSAFELEAAKNYVSADRLRETENKLTAMFEKLLNRLDAFSVVLNNLVGRMERANQESGRGP